MALKVLREEADVSQALQNHPFSISCGATSGNDRKALAAVGIISQNTLQTTLRSMVDILYIYICIYIYLSEREDF